jgi:hypothetical protein
VKWLNITLNHTEPINQLYGTIAKLPNYFFAICFTVRLGARQLGLSVSPSFRSHPIISSKRVQMP